MPTVCLLWRRETSIPFVGTEVGSTSGLIRGLLAVLGLYIEVALLTL